MGFKFGEEERLLHELDRMSVEFDCQEGLPEGEYEKKSVN